MMPNSEPAVVSIRATSPARAVLGESPVWDAARGMVWWLDIPGRRLHGYAPATGAASTLALAARLTAIDLAPGGRLIACGDPGIVLLSPGSGAFEVLAAIPMAAGFRSNDGARAPDGGFWFGTMAEDGSGRPGALYRFERSGRIECIAAEIGVPNGPAFLPDGRIVVADTAARVLHAFDPASRSGWEERRRFATFDAHEGKPDGMTIDPAGALVVAFWDGGCVRRFGADGHVAETTPLPVRRPTSCVFGGAGKRLLFVTTAQDRTGKDLPGGLLEVRFPDRGIAAL